MVKSKTLVVVVDCGGGGGVVMLLVCVCVRGTPKTRCALRRVVQRRVFRVSENLRKTAIANKKSKTDRDCEQLLHFYHAKIVNIDVRRVHVLNTNLDRHERN